MKQSQVLIITLITAVLLNACKKKDLPEPEQGNSPQFYFSGNVNGSDVRIDAGVSNYYMYSSYAQSTNNVYGFSGSLKQESCTTCSNSIQIEINDHRISPFNGTSGADSAFIPTCYPYLAGTPAPCSYYLSFYSLFNKNAASYNWSFGDGGTSTLQNPGHVYKLSGDYKVSLTMTDSFACSNTIDNIQKVGVSDVKCNTTITVTSSSTLNTTFTHSTVGAPPFNFYWDFGDGNYSAVQTPTYTYASAGRYPVSLKVVDNNGDSARANLNYLTPNGTICTSNFLMTNVYPLSNPGGWSNIIIKWTNSSGVEYTSNDAAQPSTSYFRIISSEDYHDNENGQKTKKLHIKFKCVVYSGSLSMPIDNGEAVIVVAYK